MFFDGAGRSPRKILTAIWSLMSASGASPGGYRISSNTAATTCKKPSCSAWIPNTPRACVRPCSMKTPTSPGRTHATSCASPAATPKAPHNSAILSTLRRPTPVIVTTSRLLSTGVDAQTCRLIVLDREVGSMTEFKQTVGRGTQHEDTPKVLLYLIDFRKATNHFAALDCDGEPVPINEPGEGDPVTPPDDVPAKR